MPHLLSSPRRGGVVLSALAIALLPALPAAADEHAVPSHVHEDLDVDSPGPGWEFDDVPRDHRFRDAIAWLTQQDVIEGTSETTFEPSARLTRNQMAALLWRYLDEPPPAAAPAFDDVEPADRHADAIAYLAEQEVTTGLEDGRFGGSEPVERAQMASFLWRMEGGSDDSNSAGEFNDVDPDSVHAPAIGWLVDENITRGSSIPRVFNPHETITRGQMAAFLHRLAGVPAPQPPMGEPHPPALDDDKDPRDPNPELPDDPPVQLPDTTYWDSNTNPFDADQRIWSYVYRWNGSRQATCDAFEAAIKGEGFEITKRQCDDELVSFEATKHDDWELHVAKSGPSGVSISLLIPR